jgi:hypothetical protein
MHPRFDGEVLKPIGQAGNKSKVLDYMLFTDKTDGNISSVRRCYRHPKLMLCSPDTLGVVSERPMCSPRVEGLRPVEPIVNRLIVFDRAAKTPNA